MPDQKDEELKEILQAKLDHDRNLKSYALKGDVIEGAAQLQGIVDSLAEKEYAGEMAKSIPGINKVDNGISISTDGEITDRGVEFEAGEEIYADPRVNPQHIGVKSSRGVITLVGNVTDTREIEDARQAAKKARGVTKVVSQVKVKKPEFGLEEIFHSQVNNERDEK